MKFTMMGDDQAFYYMPDCQSGGAFGTKKNKQGKLVSIMHVSGVTAKLVPTLDPSFTSPTTKNVGRTAC